MPMTFTCGGMPRWAAPQTYIGNVTVVPALKFVMMKSSNESENDSSAAATMPGKHQRQRHPPERLPLARVEVHRRLLQPRVQPGQPSLDGDHDERHAEHHVRDEDRPETKRYTGRRRRGPAATSP